MTAAAITSNSVSVPSELVAALSRAIEIAPAMAAKSPISMKIFMITQRVLTPGELGGFRIAADGIDVAAEARARRQEGRDDADADRDQHRYGDAVGDEQAAVGQRDVVCFGIAVHDAGRPWIGVDDHGRGEDQRAGHATEEDFGCD